MPPVVIYYVGEETGTENSKTLTNPGIKGPGKATNSSCPNTSYLELHD